MALGSTTGNVDHVVFRVASLRDWPRILTLGLVVAGGLMLQGCLAGAWVALVAVDTTRNSNEPADSFEESGASQAGVNSSKSNNVVFGPFEKSWVAQQDPSGDSTDKVTVRSVAVLPVEGDPEMAAQLATLLQQETSLRVESPGISVAAADLRSGSADDTDRSTLAKEVARDLGVDTVLVSRITKSPSHPSDWGRRAEGARRLYLYLVHREGQLLWKDELPFTLAKDPTPRPDSWVQTDLTRHVMQQVKVLRLDELGYLPNKEKRGSPVSDLRR